MNIIEELEKLRQKHYECDDCWYSCPMSESGCCDERAEKRCNCGADYRNSILDAIIDELEQVCEWKWRKNGVMQYICRTECNKDIANYSVDKNAWVFCPFCGRKMRIME